MKTMDFKTGWVEKTEFCDRKTGWSEEIIPCPYQTSWKKESKPYVRDNCKIGWAVEA